MACIESSFEGRPLGLSGRTTRTTAASNDAPVTARKRCIGDGSSQSEKVRVLQLTLFQDRLSDEVPGEGQMLLCASEAHGG